MAERDVFDPDDTLWTIDIAAEHLGVHRKTILRYIRDDGVRRIGEFVNRDEVLAAFRARASRERATRWKKHRRMTGL